MRLGPRTESEDESLATERRLLRYLIRTGQEDCRRSAPEELSIKGAGVAYGELKERTFSDLPFVCCPEGTE